MMMGDVYSSANYVIAWLGRAGIDARDTLELQSSIVPTLQRLINQDSWDQILGYRFDDPGFYKHFGILRPHPEAWQRYSDFHRRQWFSRTWVLQEVALAQDVLLICVSLQFSWSGTHLFGRFMIDSRWVDGLDSKLQQSLGAISSGSRQCAMAVFRNLYLEEK